MEIANFKGEIKRYEPLNKHTSFAIGGPADVLACPVDREDLAGLLKEIKRQGVKYVILGGGTNLLVRDGGVRGVVINLQHLGAIEIEREYRSVGGAFVAVRAQAGVPLPRFYFFATEQGLTGLEFAAGIPGTVGGAVNMNAGTAAGEIGDAIEAVTLVSPDGAVVTRGREEMGFGYRTANVPPGHLVVDALFTLRRGDREKIKTQVKGLMDQRKQRQPWGMPSAGSVFKNPREGSAGKLIEAAGLKGRTVGGAQVSEKHANFIVNIGKATARDVIQLMEIVQQRVFEMHGVRLEPEIKIIGEDA
jgi:UDP-N-acetylmuramate dehydrogenase